MSMTLGLGLTALAALLGAPLFVIVLAVAMLGFAHEGVNLAVVGLEMYRLTDTSLMMAIPLFTVAGFILSESRTSERLVRVSNAFLGWMPCGLAVVALLACGAFTAFTGASGATIIALGALLWPSMQQAGYPKKFSLGLLTGAGSLGLLLPPSLPLILYAIIAQQSDYGKTVSINGLFLAGIVPAVLMIVLLALWGWWHNRHENIPRQAFTWAEAKAALWDARWEIPLPFVVLGGIYSGVFAVSEAAAITVFYVLIAQCVLYREVRLTQLPRIVADAMVLVGGILMILATSLALTNVLVDAQVPNYLLGVLQHTVHSRWQFLLLLNVALLLIGSLLEVYGATVVLVPLLLPVAHTYGIDPIQLGIIFLANLQIGYLTPPIGMNLFIGALRFRQPLYVVYQSIWAPFLVLLVALGLITYVPALSLWPMHFGW